MGTHQLPPDAVSNFDLTKKLDQRIGTAAAHAVRNVPVAKPEKRVGAVLDGMRGCTFDSAVVVAVCSNGRLVGLAPIERLLAAPADAVMADVMDNDPPLVAPGHAPGTGRMASLAAAAVRRSPACSSAIDSHMTVRVHVWMDADGVCADSVATATGYR